MKKKINKGEAKEERLLAHFSPKIFALFICFNLKALE